MKNVMTYKGYMARIEFDQRDNIFIGQIVGITDSITFHGETVKALETDFHAAIVRRTVLRSIRLGMEEPASSGQPSHRRDVCHGPVRGRGR